MMNKQKFRWVDTEKNGGKNVKELIACCGLDCKRCDARIATVNNDNALRKKTADLWSELNHVQITTEMINCMGCRTTGVKTPYCDSICEIRKCVTEKGFSTCGNCPDMERCKILGYVLANSSDALNNLKLSKLRLE